VRIDQFLPSFVPNDAIGNHVLRVRHALREAGFQSDIWAEIAIEACAQESRSYTDYPSAPPADAILYHASTHSAMADFLLTRSEPLLSSYHNITPSRFFARWEPVAAAAMDEARIELAQLAPVTQLALADSRYNEAELIDLGYKRTAVTPLLIDFDQYDKDPDARMLARLRRQRDVGSRWLFVGRVAPNKCQHDIIAAFAAYRHIFDPNAHLTLVGGMTSYLYQRSLEQLAQELELGGSVEFADSISFGALLAHYHTADVFVCLSEHEGFGVPIMEAMYLGVPVVGYSAAAVPDTVGEAGVLLSDKDPLNVACAVDRILGDDALREDLVAAGRARSGQFALPKTSRQLIETLSQFLDELQARHA
jgi:glycosyltransferase involved in cell wall biosynthesis